MYHLSLATPTCFQEAVSLCTETLLRGEVVLYPTDTFYGFGADATNTEAVARVRAIKGRGKEQAILAVVSDLVMLEEYAYMTPLAYALAHAFLPGALTLILTPRDMRLSAIQALDGSVGFRIPAHSFCTTLVQALQKPITSTSANRAGVLPESSVPDILVQLGDIKESISCVVDGGAVHARKPSTIVDARGNTPIVVREGAVLKKDIALMCATL